MIYQQTIYNSIACNGIGIHSGKLSSIKFIPAPTDTGIVFIRTDIDDQTQNKVRANYKNVTSTNLGTTISNEYGVKIATIEHLMAAIWSANITNLYIEINGEEIPIMDGSSEPFIFMTENCGIKNQDKLRNIIEIKEPIKYSDGDKYIEVLPHNNFKIDIEVNFNHKLIEYNNYSFEFGIQSFKNEISRARTFGFLKEINYLNSIGLARGGSLSNAIVVDDDKILNEEGLRFKDEFVRHKMLDFIGDLSLSETFIKGYFKAYKPGHSLNNKIIHEIFKTYSQ